MILVARTTSAFSGEVILEEYLEREMILLIDIFIRAVMIYAKVLLVNTSCTHCYADSDKIATIMRRDMCISGTHKRFM